MYVCVQAVCNGSQKLWQFELEIDKGVDRRLALKVFELRTEFGPDRDHVIERPEL